MTTRPAPVLLLLAAAAALLPAPAFSAIPEAAAQTADERALLAADAEQRRAVASADIEAIRKISAPQLRVNAPGNQILTREDLMRMVASGEIRNELLVRTPENLVITGDVGVIMGHELVLPGAGSNQARMYGPKSLNRRYTNIFIRTNGAWQHLARHANVVLAPPAH